MVADAHVMSNKKMAYRISPGSWILIGTGVILFAFFAVVLNFNGLYGQDSHAYYAFSKSLRSYFSEGGALPPFYWPYGYSFSGYLVSFTGLPILESLRLVSIVALIGTLLRTRKLIFELFGKESWLWILLAGFLQIYFLRSGMVVMSDALATWLSVSALLSVVRFRKTARPDHFVLALVYAGLAVWVRLAAMPLLIVPILVLLVDLWKMLKWPGKVLLALVGLTGTVTMIGLYSSYLMELMAELTTRWSLTYSWAMQVKDADGYMVRTVPNILYVFGNFGHIGFLSVGIALIPFYRKPSVKMTWIIIAMLILYLFFLVGLSTQNYRFLVMSHPLVLVLLFPAFMRCWNWLSTRKWQWLFVGAMVLFNVAFDWYSFRKTYQWYQLERSIATVVHEELKSDNTPIYAFYVDQAFPSYGIENKVYNFYQADYDNFKSGALVVFSPEQLQEQWKGSRVMNNWNRLISTRNLDTLHTFDSNWKLYRIK